MQFTQIRNATIQIHYAGKKFLLDPMLAAKEAYPGFAGTLNSHLRYPTVELPLSMEEILDVDAVIVTHTHADHWDQAAIDLIPKSMLIFVQNEQDAQILAAQGFTQLRILSDNTDYEGISLSLTEGQHGSDAILEVLSARMGIVSGVVFKHPAEKTLYIAGDTIWNSYVSAALLRHQPDVIVMNSGDAQIPGLGSIIMGKQDVLSVYDAAPKATLIASHMEAVNHAGLTRAELRQFLQMNMMTERVLVPEDGESYRF